MTSETAASFFKDFTKTTSTAAASTNCCCILLEARATISPPIATIRAILKKPKISFVPMASLMFRILLFACLPVTSISFPVLSDKRFGFWGGCFLIFAYFLLCPRGPADPSNSEAYS